MVSEALWPIISTLFLSLLMEKLNSAHIWNTFTCFGEEAMGNSFPDEGLGKMSAGAPIDKNGEFNCTEFTHILKNGTQDKEDR